MLQQTQVSRVIEKYKSFLKKFPTVKKLANAKLGEVLKVWSGLGYNRRGKYLHDAAKTIVEKHGSKVPRDFALLRALPGIGPYTASAVRVFAFNEPDILIETNIRTTYIQLTGFISGFTKSRYEKFRDDELLSVATTAAKGQDPRSWHWALMDYGAHLKRMGVRNNHKSAHYAKQSKFEGSLRQVRGAILRALSQDEEINDLRNRYKGFVEKGLAGLKRDGLIVKEKGKWRIA
jgi:A/G-specific adenine glycosylase